MSRSTLQTRDQTIVSLYKDGHTLQHIGTMYGLSRERIRQILDANGVARRAAGAQPTNAYEQWVAEHGDVVEAKMRRHPRARVAVPALAYDYPDVPITWLRRLASERIGRHEWTGEAKRNFQYSHEEMLATLRRYAKDGRLSSKRYLSLASDDDPSVTTYLVRYGSWSAACAKAGLTSTATRSYERTWTEAEMLADLREFVGDMNQAGLYPSVERYARWRHKSPTARPSVPTMRIQTGRRWNELIKEATQ